MKQIKLIIASIVIFALLSVVATNSAYAVDQKVVDAKKVPNVKKVDDKKGVDAKKVAGVKKVDDKKGVGNNAGSATILIPSGMSSPGCETTQKCYSPYSQNIKVGGTVTWKNTDTKAHTVTSGNPKDGPSGVFDSGLIKKGDSFSKIFDKIGTYDYFDMIHPWMKGKVVVS